MKIDMKLNRLLIAGAVATATLAFCPESDAQRLVVLHTNDTHSQIDPDKNDRGGILRRKVLIDSVRAVEPNVMVVDAGDAVQGSLFFTLFEGEVEQKMLNALGYDLQIVGNHEFDNGLDKLAANYAKARPQLVSSNYDFSATPLKDMFKPYYIKNVDGKRIAFIGVNVSPKGLIDPDNYAGLLYYDNIKTANALADYLKTELGVDRVVALSHIGYDEVKGHSDVDLAAAGSNIDVIIGGHSHDFVYPGAPKGFATTVANKDGRPVAIAQMGKGGQMLGEIVIDFDAGDAPAVSARAIEVDKRLDKSVTEADRALLAPYRHKVDSISAIAIGSSAHRLDPSSAELQNILADWAMIVGERLISRRPDFALVNKGGIRNFIPEGTVTQGDIINMMPFNNRVVVVEIKGDSLSRLMEIIAGQGGQAVSKEVKGKINPKKGLANVKINGREIDPEKTYTVATIDYLARGGDNMTPLATAQVIAKSPNLLYRDLIDEFVKGTFKDKVLKGDKNARLKTED